MTGFIGVLIKFALVVIALFMILLILVQRGRGGGLAGALGGPGGSSAFGAKAGDAFTRITAVTALIWMALCIGASLYFSSNPTSSGFKTVDQRKAVPARSDDAGTGAGEMGAIQPDTEGAELPAGGATPPADPATSDSTPDATDDNP